MGYLEGKHIEKIFEAYKNFGNIENFSAVATFLAPLCSELHLVNPSADRTDIKEYIRDNEFDLVLYALSAGRINERYFQ